MLRGGAPRECRAECAGKGLGELNEAVAHAERFCAGCVHLNEYHADSAQAQMISKGSGNHAIERTHANGKQASFASVKSTAIAHQITARTAGLAWSRLSGTSDSIPASANRA